MAITLDGMMRPRASQKTAFSPALTAGTPIETDTGGEESFFFPVNITANPTSFTVANCTTTNGETAVTAAAGSFSFVRAGNPVSGTGIDTDTTVAAVAPDGSSITLSQAAIASGTVTLTFDPPALTATVFGVRVKILKQDSTVRLQATLHAFDGSLGGTAGTPATATKSSATPLTESVDLDAFYLNIQVPRDP